MMKTLNYVWTAVVCGGAVALLAALYSGCDKNKDGKLSVSEIINPLAKVSAPSSETPPASETFTYFGKELSRDIETKIGKSNYSLYSEGSAVGVREIRYLNKWACTSVKVSKNILPDDCICIDGFFIADQDGDEEYDSCSHSQTLSCVDVEEGEMSMTDSACKNRFKSIFNKIARAYELDELQEWETPEALSYSELSEESICDYIGEKQGLMNWKREKFGRQFNEHISEVRAEGLVRDELGIYFEVRNPKILQGPGCMIYGSYEKITKKNDSVWGREECGFGYMMKPLEESFTALKGDDDCNTDFKGTIEEFKKLF